MTPQLAVESSKFFLTPQLPIDAAGMDGDAEALPDSVGQLRARNPRFAEAEFCHKLHPLGCKRVPGRGAPLARQKTSQPGVLKRRLSLIERGTREAKRLDCLADRLL